MIEVIAAYLFPDDGTKTYAIIDGAACDNLRPHLEEFKPEHLCLYSGELTSDIVEVAPYLITLGAGHRFTDWLLAEGIGKHWGVFVNTRADIRTLRKHFRRFLMVKSTDGEQVYFRYYDPRVLRVFLPSCTYTEVKVFCGPVIEFLMEGETPDTFLRCVSSVARLDSLNLLESVASQAATLKREKPDLPEREGTRGSTTPFRISHSQMAAFSVAEKKGFNKRVSAHLRRFFPETIDQMTDRAINKLIEDGQKRAERYAVRTERNVCLYIDVMLMLGAEFDNNPHFAWARTLLEGSEHPNERMTSLYLRAAKEWE